MLMINAAVKRVMLELIVDNLSVKVVARTEAAALDPIDVPVYMDLPVPSVKETTEQGPASHKSAIRCVRVR